MASGPHDTYTVGYGRPPVEHQFKRGESGNPKGRSPKTLQADPVAASTALDAILIEEMDRVIDVPADGGMTKMSVARKLVRDTVQAASDGDHKARVLLLATTHGAQMREAEADLSLYADHVEYKRGWNEHFRQCDEAGVARPEVVPHPDDVVYDEQERMVMFNGPHSEREKARWDSKHARRTAALRAIQSYRANITNIADSADSAELCSFLHEEIEREKALADMIYGMCPPEEIRRRPGFSLQRWRKRRDPYAIIRKMRTASAVEKAACSD